MLDDFLNADLLYQIYTIVGFFVVGFILKVLYTIAKKTKNKIDDKIIETFLSWHKSNKDKMK